MAETWLLAVRCPGYRWRDSGFGSGPELENLFGGDKGKGTSGSSARPKVLIRRAGAGSAVLRGEGGTATWQGTSSTSVGPALHIGWRKSASHRKSKTAGPEPGLSVLTAWTYGQVMRLLATNNAEQRVGVCGGWIDMGSFTAPVLR